VAMMHPVVTKTTQAGRCESRASKSAAMWVASPALMWSRPQRQSLCSCFFGLSSIARGGGGRTDKLTNLLTDCVTN